MSDQEVLAAVERFGVPTGGATVASFGDYLARASVFAVGGSRVAPRADVIAWGWGWNETGARARAVVAERIVHAEALVR